MTWLSSDFSVARLPRAILFDHDGVLVSSEPLHLKAWEHLVAEMGLPRSTDTILRMVGKTAPEIISTILDQTRPGWRDAMPPLDPHALALRKNDFYLKLASTELAAYPGVPEGLRWLREQGVKLAVVSNSRRRELEAGLRKAGLIELFDELVSRDDVPAHKPDPTPYLFAAATFDAEPADCLAVEDSPPGIEAGLVAKIPCAAVLTNFPERVMRQPVPGRPDLKPVWVGPTMRDLFAWLGFQG